MKRLIPSVFFGLALLLLPGLAWAQQGTITGTVTEAETDNPLPGATVQIPDVGTGAATDSDGQYRIAGVPAGEQTLRVTFVGYQAQERTVDVPSGGTVRANFQLRTTEAELDEIVVTGVSVGTETEKLGFDVSKLSEGQLQEVPGTDPANALRAKTPGARIVQGSGEPGTAPSVRLRGTTTLSGDQEPLLVVDGAITSGSLEDIDTQSIKSIEIIKGAAAASLYGSLAGNGVIQVITDRGEGNEDGTTRVTFRNEVGFTQLPSGQIDLATHHNKDASKADSDLSEGGFRIPTDEPGPGNIAPEADHNIFQNEFSEVNDQQEAIYDPRSFLTNYVSVSSRQGDLNYLLSFENQRNDGVAAGFDPYERRNFRVNIDNQVSESFDLSGSFLYNRNSGTDFLENGQFADSPFYSALLAWPDLDLESPPPEGSEPAENGAEFNPFLAGGNAANPLYRRSVTDRDFSGDRLFANLQANYDITDYLSLEGQFSWDEDTDEFRSTVDAGAFPADPTGSRSQGSIFQSRNSERLYTAQGRATFNKEFGELETTLSGRYQYEDREIENSSVGGDNFVVSGIKQFDNTDPDQLSAGEFDATIRSEDIVGNLVLDYRDTYVIDGVLRRERVSLFGPDARDKIYYRLAGTYRLAQDVNIPNVQELKLRGSFGTSGSRPPFAAQYETFSVGTDGITKERLGNSEIQPAEVEEFELGTDMFFLDRFSLSATYSESDAADQVLDVPLPGALGFDSQFQNAGTIETNTFEFSANGQILRGENYGLDLGVVFDRTRQTVTELGRPGFTDNVGSQIPLFRIGEGVDIGVMFGNEFATSIGDLRFDDDGCLVGESGDLNGDCLTEDNLTINDDGYVIEEGTEYATGNDDFSETPFLIRNEDGSVETRKIGDSNPDFNMGFNATFNYGGFSLFTAVDWEQGADVYNYTKQLLYFNERHGDLDQTDQPEGQRRDSDYYINTLYNGASASSHFVEDGSFVKVREISVSYNFTPEFLSSIGLGRYVHDAKFSILGRNLLTFTDYDGYDPEVSTDTADQPVNYKVDDFAYPNFRSYSASLELRF